MADDIVIEEVEENDAILDWVWDRIILLDQAVKTNDPSILIGPEMGWECNELYCEADSDFRTNCNIPT